MRGDSIQCEAGNLIGILMHKLIITALIHVPKLTKVL